jgi:hypothetical protein
MRKNCVKILELERRFVRLRNGINTRVPATAANPRLTDGARQSSDRTAISSKERCNMRSDLVFGALSHVSNRYRLCQLASKATRKLHKPNTRLQDTTNEVLGRFQSTNPGAAAGPVEAPETQHLERRRAA